MTDSGSEDTTFGGLFDGSSTRPPRRSRPGVVVPDQASLTAMSIDELEQLLVNLMAEQKDITPEQLLEESMLDGSLRTSSILMLALITQVGASIGQKLVKPSDLDDSGRLRTLRGTAQALKALLERLDAAQ